MDLNVIGNFKYLHRSSVWFLDFFALIKVAPLLLNPPKITALLHCADPLFSEYLKEFKFDEPFITSGKFFYFLT